MDGTRASAADFTEGYEDSSTERSAVRITRAQSKTYEAIVRYMLEYGYAPSIRRICKLAGFKSPSAVHRQMEALNRMGLISIFRTSDGAHVTVPGIDFVDHRPEALYEVV